jgi:hypothetical protein
VTVPSGISALGSPMLPAVGPATIPRNQDLALAWSGGSGQLLVEILGDVRLGPTLLCEFPASAQSGTLPMQALAAIPAGSYQLELFTADLKTLPTNNGYIHVAAGTLYRGASAMLP